MNKLIAQHRRISAQIKSLQTELEAIERDPEYAKEREFVEQLDKLMQQHGKSSKDIVSMLDPFIDPSARVSERGAKPGTPRKRVTYKNPHTGEEVKSASGNNRILKEWKKKYPNEDLRNWVVKES